MKREYLFFTHILKAGGTTVEAALRRALGIRHMAVDPPTGWIYTPADFDFDRRLNPIACSFSSHWLRPFQSYGRFDSRIRWYTMLREPLARYRSHRQHHIERFASRRPFEEWAADAMLGNWQTRQLAGEADVLAAKQILQERCCVVGLLEQMDCSLLLFSERLGLPALRPATGEVHNQAFSTELRAELQEEFERHAELVEANNSLDLELYEFAAHTIFPAQVRAYGTERMQRQLAEPASPASSLLGQVRAGAQLLFRRGIQLPAARVRRRAQIRAGRPDIRR